jgi:hypothetical protein
MYKSAFSALKAYKGTEFCDARYSARQHLSDRQFHEDYPSLSDEK